MSEITELKSESSICIAKLEENGQLQLKLGNNFLWIYSPI